MEAAIDFFQNETNAELFFSSAPWRIDLGSSSRLTGGDTRRLVASCRLAALTLHCERLRLALRNARPACRHGAALHSSLCSPLCVAPFDKAEFVVGGGAPQELLAA